MEFVYLCPYLLPPKANALPGVALEPVFPKPNADIITAHIRNSNWWNNATNGFRAHTMLQTARIYLVFYVLKRPIYTTTHFIPTTAEMHTTDNYTTNAWRPSVDGLWSPYDQRIGRGVSKMIGNLVLVRCSIRFWYI